MARRAETEIRDRGQPMILFLRVIRTIASAAILACWGCAWTNAQPKSLSMEPLHESGQSVTGAFEGWFQNPDGTYSLLFGYFNRNLTEELDIPIGPNNRIEPGGPDRGQPTHFLTRRQWGVFTVTVPKNFGEGKLTWTLVANHQATVIPASLNPLWELSPFHEEGMGNTPPTLAFAEAGPTVQGPRAISTLLEATISNPLPLTLWVADDARTLPGGKPPRTPPVSLRWSKFRGPGEVKIANPHPAVVEAPWQAAGVFHGKAVTTATFSEPGEYVLRVVANDWSGDGGQGFQCCWTNALVKVQVK
jgi:hypothetical protein